MWVRLDVGFLRHPKIAELSQGAQLLFIAAICYAHESKTDGKIMPRTLENLLPLARATAANIDELLVAGLLQQSEGGAVIVHDFLGHNPSAEEMAQKHQARVEAGRVGGHAKAARSHAPSKAVANASQDATTEPLANAVANGLAKSKHVNVTTTDTSTREIDEIGGGGNTNRAREAPAAPTAAILDRLGITENGTSGTAAAVQQIREALNRIPEEDRLLLAGECRNRYEDWDTYPPGKKAGLVTKWVREEAKGPPSERGARASPNGSSDLPWLPDDPAEDAHYRQWDEELRVKAKQRANNRS